MIYTSNKQRPAVWLIELSIYHMYTTPQFAEKTGKVPEGTNGILDTLSAEHTQQAFMHASRIFHRYVSIQMSNRLHGDDSERG